jgi:hypothetical protein
VDAVIFTDGTATVYNLTVDEAHTYFVGDGAWLVHNCGGPDDDGTDYTNLLTDPATNQSGVNELFEVITIKQAKKQGLVSGVISRPSTARPDFLVTRPNGTVLNVEIKVPYREMGRKRPESITTVTNNILTGIQKIQNPTLVIINLGRLSPKDALHLMNRIKQSSFIRRPEILGVEFLNIPKAIR